MPPVFLVWDARTASHHADSHPENHERLSAIVDLLRDRGMLERCQLVCAVAEASDEELKLAHSDAHVAFLRNVGEMDADARTRAAASLSSVYLCPATGVAARLAAGASLELVRRICGPDPASGFAIVRPPGHHACHNQAMGFCFVNNVVLAARHALHAPGIRRVLIVDWDVHHGNGTQEAFIDDPNVLFISVHRYDDGSFYPCSPDAAARQVGGPAARGRTVNVAWSGPGRGDADYALAFDTVVMPIATEWDPDLVLVSAGFDAALGDPLGGCRVTPAGFAAMLHRLRSLADGRVGLFLEGGYAPSTLAACALACVGVLLGHSPPRRVQPDPDPEGAAVVDAALRPGDVRPSEAAVKDIAATVAAQRPYWRCLVDAAAAIRADRGSAEAGPGVEAAAGAGAGDAGEEDVNPEFAHSVGARQAEEAKKEATWECRPCTLLNSVADDECQACGASRPGTLDAAGPVRAGAGAGVAVEATSFFSVAPLKHCPHVESAVAPPPAVQVLRTALTLRCQKEGCGASETWICAACHRVLCGRYAERHMSEHATKAMHCVALSPADLSTWCYACDAYLDQYAIPAVGVLYARAHEAKFDTRPPGQGAMFIELQPK